MSDGPPQVKTCTKCGEAKLLEEFYRDRGRADGCQTRCKTCSAEYGRRWQVENRERRQEQRSQHQAERNARERQRRAENPELYRERERRRREANMEQHQERQHRYYEANRERLLEYSRQHRAQNQEQYRERQRQWYEANKEQILERQRRRMRENREQYREGHRQWYEGLKAAVFAHYGECCACCGTTECLSIDHVNGDGNEHRIELSGRSTTLYVWLRDNGFPSGFQTLCRPCNGSKRTGDCCRLDHTGTPDAPASRP